MARKPRDYQAEYARRLELGRKRGHSKARARGHGVRLPTSPKVPNAVLSERLDQAYAVFRDSRNLTRSAKAAKVSPERFRAYLRANKLVRKRGNAWSLLADNRVRRIEMLTEQGWKVLVVRGFQAASEIGSHSAAVRQFKDSGDVRPLAPFVGKGVTDIDDGQHVFETRPNHILRAIKSGRGSFEQVYRIVSR